MNHDRKAQQARSFGAVAELYDRARPGYPPEAADWVLEAVPPGGTVVDLGAGTGKFTRLLVEQGRAVVAVEPSTEMGEQLKRVLPSVDVRPGSAESLPLPNRSVDAIVAAQAWHWVDEAQAVPEAARVLKPGGTLGLIWNTRDESVGWVAELGARLKDVDSASPSGWAGVGAPFGSGERRDFAWSVPLTPDGLLDLVRSRSNVLVAPEDVREALLDSVRDLLATDPALAGRDQFQMPYITECWRHRLPS